MEQLQNQPESVVGVAIASLCQGDSDQLLYALGTPEILAKGVLAYDLAVDGTILYTNGSAIYTISPDGTRKRILTDNWIESVAVLDQ